MSRKNSRSISTSDSTSDTFERSKDIEAGHSIEGKVQTQSLNGDSIYDDTQLLRFLQDKTATRDLPSFIKEIHGSLDLHPIKILTALGVDLTAQLGDCYHFFSWTRYPSGKHICTRDRLTEEGHHCWSQDGGKVSTVDANHEVSSEDTIVGSKRKFTFMERPLSLRRSHMMVGPKSYIFRLEELATAEDEENEKMMLSARQTPKSYLCVYRLFPVMQSKISKKLLQRWVLVLPWPGPAGQNSRLIFQNPGKSLPKAPDLESTPTLVFDDEKELREFPRAEETTEKLLTVFNLGFSVLPEFDLKSNQESSPEAQGTELNYMMCHPDPGNTNEESSILYNAEEWNSPKLIYMASHAERYDREWIGPFMK